MATATYEPIATTTLGSAAASITFSSIAATWTDLRLVVVYKSTWTAFGRLRINGDTGANYSQTPLLGDGSTASSTRLTSNTSVEGPQAWNDGFAMTTYDLMAYGGSTYKTVLATYSLDKNGSGIVERDVALWRSTSAINALSFYTASNAWDVGTTATLYGIKAA